MLGLEEYAWACWGSVRAMEFHERKGAWLS